MGRVDLLLHANCFLVRCLKLYHSLASGGFIVEYNSNLFPLNRAIGALFFVSWTFKISRPSVNWGSHVRKNQGCARHRNSTSKLLNQPYKPPLPLSTSLSEMLQQRQQRVSFAKCTINTTTPLQRKGKLILNHLSKRIYSSHIYYLPSQCPKFDSNPPE